MNRKCIKIFKQDYPWLFLVCCISLILGIMPFIYCLISFEWKYKLFGFIFLLPVLLIFLISAIFVRGRKQASFVNRFLLVVLNSFVIIFIQIFFCFFILILLSISDVEDKCNQIKYYKLALSKVDQSKTLHFPRSIPKEAKNAELKSSIFSVFGSEDLYLKFEVNRDFIDKELRKYKFVNVCKNGKCKNETAVAYRYYSGNIDIQGFTFYVINDRESENLPEHNFPYHYGIGVNYDTNQILYYYENPD